VRFAEFLLRLTTDCEGYVHSGSAETIGSGRKNYGKGRNRAEFGGMAAKNRQAENEQDCHISAQRRRKKPAILNSNRRERTGRTHRGV
jgi:hypothetical protein